MINAITKDEAISQFKNDTKDMFKSSRNNFDLNKHIEAGDVTGIRDVVKKIQSIMIACIPEGLNIPKVAMYVSAAGFDDISLINIKITNTIVSLRKFSYALTVTKDNSTEKIFDFLMNVYVALVIDELINENLSKVNDVLFQIVAESGIEYNIKIVSPLGNEGKVIAYISDDEIAFVADENKVFELNNIIVLMDGATDVISEEVIQDHYKTIVEEISTAQTTPQLVGIHGGALISYVCGISSRVKPITMIKKSCTKNVLKLSGDKDAIAYFSKDDVYSIVARREGNFEILLSPFDVNTLCKVDYDVLGEIVK